MRRLKVTIGGLMVVMAFVAAGFAALHRPTRLWASVWLSATIACLTVAMLGAFFRRGPVRAFWSGFALSGWLYLLLTFGPWFQEQIGDRLPTDFILALGYPWVIPPPEPEPPVPQPEYSPPPTPAPLPAVFPPDDVAAPATTAPRPAPPADPAKYVEAAITLHKRGVDALAARYLKAANDYRDMLSDEDQAILDQYNLIIPPSDEDPLLQAPPSQSMALPITPPAPTVSEPDEDPRMRFSHALWRQWTIQDSPLIIELSELSKTFRMVGHSLFCLIIAFIGGLVARGFALREARSNTNTPNPEREPTR